MRAMLTTNISPPAIIIFLRPIQSASMPATSEAPKPPMEYIATTKESCPSVTLTVLSR